MRRSTQRCSVPFADFHPPRHEAANLRPLSQNPPGGTAQTWQQGAERTGACRQLRGENTWMRRQTSAGQQEGENRTETAGRENKANWETRKETGSRDREHSARAETGRGRGGKDARTTERRRRNAGSAGPGRGAVGARDGDDHDREGAGDTARTRTGGGGEQAAQTEPGRPSKAEPTCGGGSPGGPRARPPCTPEGRLVTSPGPADTQAAGTLNFAVRWAVAPAAGPVGPWLCSRLRPRRPGAQLGRRLWPSAGRGSVLGPPDPTPSPPHSRPGRWTCPWTAAARS